MTRGLSTVDACTRRSSWTMVYFRLTVFTQSAPGATYLRPFPLMFGLSRRPHLNAHLTNQTIFESSVGILSLLTSPWSWKAVPHCQSVLKPSFHQLVSHSTVVVGAEWKDWLPTKQCRCEPQRGMLTFNSHNQRAYIPLTSFVIQCFIVSSRADWHAVPRWDPVG